MELLTVFYLRLISDDCVVGLVAVNATAAHEIPDSIPGLDEVLFGDSILGRWKGLSD